MKNINERIVFFQMIIGNMFFILLGIVLLRLWESKSILFSLNNLFSIKDSMFSLIIGITGSMLAVLYAYIIIRIGKADFPDTEGSNMMILLANNQKISLFGLILIPAIAEEFFFRGIIQPFITELLNPFWGIIITAIIFMLFHISNQYKGQPFLLFHIFWLGILTGIAFWITENLWAPIIIHLINNFWSVKQIRKGKIRIKNTV